MSEDDFSDEDISQFTNWTNAGKYISDLRLKAQEELSRKLQNAAFDESNDFELSPPPAKKTRGKTCKYKKNGIKGSLIASPPHEPELLLQSRETNEPCKRVTRSESRSKRNTPVLDCVDLTGSNDDMDSRVTGVISRLLPRPKIFEDSSIIISDDSDEDISFTSLLVEEDINYEVSVKVRWRFKDIHKFKIRKFQKLTSVFEYFAKLENVPEDQVYLTLNDTIIVPSDTPDTINLSIANIIDGSILVVRPIDSITKAHCNSPISKDSIQLKVCTKDSKVPILVRLGKTEKMRVLMSKIVEEVGKPPDSLKFLFDGETLDPNETPDGLDLEGGELIELRIANC